MRCGRQRQHDVKLYVRSLSKECKGQSMPLLVFYRDGGHPSVAHDTGQTLLTLGSKNVSDVRSRRGARRG
jgi:hypothetical protein